MQARRLERAGSKLGVSWSKGSKLEWAGASWEAGESWERAGARGARWEAGESWEQAGVRGASWEAGESWEWAGRLETAGSKLEWGEWAGREGSQLQLAPTLPIAPCPQRLQGPRDALGARGASWEWGEWAGSKGSELGASWGSRKDPGTQGPSITFGSVQLAPSSLQGPRDALGARGASWEQGKSAGSKGSQLGASWGQWWWEL